MWWPQLPAWGCLDEDLWEVVRVRWGREGQVHETACSFWPHSCSEERPREHTARRRPSISKLGRGGPPRTWPCGHPDLGLAASRTIRTKSMLWRLHSLRALLLQPEQAKMLSLVRFPQVYKTGNHAICNYFVIIHSGSKKCPPPHRQGGERDR